MCIVFVVTPSFRNLLKLWRLDDDDNNDEGDWLRVLNEIRDDKFNENDNTHANMNEKVHQEQEQDDYDFDFDYDSIKKSKKSIGAAVFDNE